MCPATELPRCPGSAPCRYRGLGADTAAACLLRTSGAVLLAVVVVMRATPRNPRYVGLERCLAAKLRVIFKAYRESVTRGGSQKEFTAVLFVGQDLVAERRAMSWLWSFPIP